MFGPQADIANRSLQSDWHNANRNAWNQSMKVKSRSSQ